MKFVCFLNVEMFQKCLGTHAGKFKQRFQAEIYRNGVADLRLMFCEFRLFDHVGAPTHHTRNLKENNNVPHEGNKYRIAAHGVGELRRVG